MRLRRTDVLGSIHTTPSRALDNIGRYVLVVSRDIRTIESVSIGQHCRHETPHQAGGGFDRRIAGGRPTSQGAVVASCPLPDEEEPAWPVLYLFHGCCDSYVSWTRSTDIEQLTEHLDVLVAMPEGGLVGFYSDWQSGPRWETFHTIELPMLLAQNYGAGTIAAVAGLSMGGLGALDYAARHPGMFTLAASFSGIVHTRLSSDESQGYLGLIQSEGQDPLALWGDPEAQVDIWKQHNPYDLAPQLRDVRLFISAGNGQPGPLDKAGTSEDSIETQIGAESRAFAERVQQLGLNATIDLYGPGTHNWVYFQRQLHRAWPMIIDGLGLK